jgi:hypothetical protein
MGYFRELPDVEYQSFLTDRRSSQDYLTVKNFFRRVKLRDDLQTIFTVFDKYTIPDGARPDTVAEDLYGDSTLDWVVLIVAGILNVNTEWPLSDRDLYRFAENKYGIAEMNSEKFYETYQVVDSLNRLILPAGLVVDSNFTIPNPDIKTSTITPTRSVSNYEYEVRENDKKRQIYILKNQYLDQFLSDSRALMLYTDSSEYINELLIRTENTRVTTPN